ncbi:MAG TPA: hypothetical protein VLT35_03835 [Methanocella sp.]|nr:hypothetical protein [Methanocella sp.]
MKSLATVCNAVIIGVLMAISLAVLYLLVLNNLWWELQWSYGHAMFHQLDYYVMGAQYMQGLSLLIVLSMTAGALTMYFSRSAADGDRAAASAGALSGLIIACVFSICAMIIFLFVSAGVPDSLGYIASNAPMILFMSLIVPGIASVPSAAAGAVILRRNMSDAGGTRPRHISQGTALLLAIVATIALAGLTTAVISLYYGIPPAFPAVYSIPLLLVLPLLAAGMNAPYKKGSMPIVIVILALSVIAIVFLPLAGTALACNTGLIATGPYEWEHPAQPDVYMMVLQNVSSPVEDLARNLAGNGSFDWGMSIFLWQGDEANREIVENVNASTCDIGVIGRTLRPEEAVLGLNQTVVARNGVGNEIVFIMKGECPANVTRFIGYVTGPEGRVILENDGYLPA